MKVISKFILAISVILLISSCSDNSNEELQYFSFKYSPNDKWGIIDGKGNIIAEDEYTNQPIIVNDGMYFVPNDEGQLYLYSIDEPTKEIDVNFKQAYLFDKGVAPTVKKGECIKFIDKKGNVAFELSPEYTQAVPSGFGWTLLKKETDSANIEVYVNNKGEFFEPKKYKLQGIIADNVFFAAKEDKVYLINNKEEELFGFSEAQSNIIIPKFTKDIKYYVYKDDNYYGIKKIDGEVVTRAKYKFMDFSDNYIIFSSDYKYYGIMNLDGEIIVKEKYKQINSIKNKKFIAAKDSKEFGLLNMDEDKLLNFEYEKLEEIPGTEYYVAKKIDDKSVYIINKKGEPISKKTEFEELEVISLENAADNFFIKSDYFDAQQILKSLFEPNKERNITNMFGNQNKTPQDIANDLSIEYFNYNDIKYAQGMYWLPSPNINNADWNIKCETAFNEYLDYWCSEDSEDEGCELSTTEKCKEVKILGTMTNKNRSHYQEIIEKIDSYLSNKGFKKGENNIYSNSEFTIAPFYIERDYQIGFWIIPIDKK